MAYAALERAQMLLRTEIAPRAQEVDESPEVLKWALKRMAEENLLALKRPEPFGGPDITEEEFRLFQEEVARTSGALAFLQTQHQSAVSMIAKGTNEALKRDYLPYMADGRKLVGIGFSQLRREGAPLLCAERVDYGYELNGHVPWVTGLDFFPEFLVGASLPDGQAVFGVAPLGHQPGVRVSKPMALAAMESANTVTVDFDRFVLPDPLVAFLRPQGWIRNNDNINIALQGHFALGCAQAGLDVLSEAAAKRPSQAMDSALQSLSAELAECREATRKAQRDSSEETTDERLSVRSWAIELCMRCAHAAVTASSGAANYRTHPAQRILREALVYTVSAQTRPILEATLRRLTLRSPALIGHLQAESDHNKLA